MKLSPHRYIGLDWGSVRIGVAVSPDADQVFPRDAILNTSEDQVAAQLQEVCNDIQADTIVIGLPRNMKGQETDMAEHIRTFGAWVQQVTGCDVVYEDERLTSQFAEQKRIMKSQKSTDSLAALAILENYLAKR